MDPNEQSQDMDGRPVLSDLNETEEPGHEQTLGDMSPEHLMIGNATHQMEQDMGFGEPPV